MFNYLAEHLPIGSLGIRGGNQFPRGLADAAGDASVSWGMGCSVSQVGGHICNWAPNFGGAYTLSAEGLFCSAGTVLFGANSL